MMAFPSLISFLTTSRCTAACPNCCFRCTPTNRDTLTLDDFERAFRAASKIPSLRVAVFTGGEATLLGDTLRQAIAMATRNGYASRLVTNGSWAVTPAAARDYLRTLQEAGLREINFSTGVEHSLFVPAIRVAHGAEAAAELGITCAIYVECPDGALHYHNAFVQLPTMRALLEARRVLISANIWSQMNVLCEPSTQETAPEIPERWRRSRPCRHLLESMNVSCDGRIFACCGLTVDRIPQLAYSDLRTESHLEDLVSKPDDLLFLWIKFFGPESLFLKFHEHFPEERKRGLTHSCQFCSLLFELDRDLLNPVLQEAQEDLTNRLSMWFTDRLTRAVSFGASFPAETKGEDSVESGLEIPLLPPEGIAGSEAPAP